MPAKEFYDTQLTDGERRRLRVSIERLAEDARVANEERFKRIEGTDSLWEFKLHQVRMPGFYMPGGRFVLTHGFRKKQDRIHRSEIAVAEQIREEHLARERRPGA